MLAKLSSSSCAPNALPPSAFSFSSRSLSSGHLLERRVWARSPIPPPPADLLGARTHAVVPSKYPFRQACRQIARGRSDPSHKTSCHVSRWLLKLALHGNTPISRKLQTEIIVHACARVPYWRGRQVGSSGIAVLAEKRILPTASSKGCPDFIRSQKECIP